MHTIGSNQFTQTGGVTSSDQTKNQGTPLIESPPPSSSFLQRLSQKVGDLLTVRNYWRFAAILIIYCIAGSSGPILSLITIIFGAVILTNSHLIDDTPYFAFSKICQPNAASSSL